MTFRSPRLIAGFALTVAALAVPSVASAATYTVRVEGGDATPLLAETAVGTSGAAVNKDGMPGHTCPGGSAADALEVATAGNWTGTYYSGFGYTVDRIFGANYPFGANKTWAYYVDETYQNVGVCAVPNGTRILFYASCIAPNTTGCYTGEPLRVTAPGTARPDTPFPVTVTGSTTTYDANYSGTTTKGPAAGATVNGAPLPTAANGQTQVTFHDRGPTVIVASRGGDVPARTSVCVTDGADGYCGTKLVAETSTGTTTTTTPPPPAGPAPGAPATAPSLAADTTPPTATVAGIDDNEVFAAGKGPRELRGTAGTPPSARGAVTLLPDPSGIRTVKLRLTRRTAGGRCQTYSKTKERFVPAKCGADNGTYFTIGAKAVWSYLLPFRLKTGTYVLDVKATDGAGNTDTARKRGQNRIAFRVR